MGTNVATGNYRKSGRPRVAVDAARARALRDLGWTLDEIADEFGCARGTVARALERTESTRLAPAAAPVAVGQIASELAR
ncbi:MAG: helix-turn-helix domain-containing protein, partial [Candidatus Saccharimonadales bacterium]